MKKHTFFIILIIGIAILIGIWRDNHSTDALTSTSDIVTKVPLTVGTALAPHKLPEFSLTDSNGNPFSNATLKDKWSFLFFGYSRCPDVCPTTLAAMNQIASRLGNNHNIQFVFISIDPLHDTPQILKKYLQQDKFQSTAFVGVTGDKKDISTLAKKVGIHMQEEQKLPKGKESIEHGGAILLVNPEGKLMAIFSAVDKPNAIVRDFKDLVHYYVNTV